MEPTYSGWKLNRGKPRGIRTASVVEWMAPVIEETVGVNLVKRRVHVETLLRQLVHKCGLVSCAFRLCLLSLAFSCVVLGALGTFTIPQVPIRGDRGYFTDLWLLGLLAFVLNLIVFVMWDAAQLCGRYIHNLARHQSEWPRELREAASRETGVSRAYVDSWLDVQSIARATGAVTVLLYGLSVIACIIAALSLRRGAEYAREREITRLGQSLASLDSEDEEDLKWFLRSEESSRDVVLSFGHNFDALYLESLRTDRDRESTCSGVDPTIALAVADLIPHDITDDGKHMKDRTLVRSYASGENDS